MHYFYNLSCTINEKLLLSATTYIKYTYTAGETQHLPYV